MQANREYYIFKSPAVTLQVCYCKILFCFIYWYQEKCKANFQPLCGNIDCKTFIKDYLFGVNFYCIPRGMASYSRFPLYFCSMKEQTSHLLVNEIHYHSSSFYPPHLISINRLFLRPMILQYSCKSSLILCSCTVSPNDTCTLRDS